MSKKFKFPPIPARRCPDRLEQENTVRVRPVKKVTPEVETFTDDDIEVELDGNAAFLIRLTDPAEGIIGPGEYPRGKRNRLGSWLRRRQHTHPAAAGFVLSDHQPKNRLGDPKRRRSDRDPR